MIRYVLFCATFVVICTCQLSYAIVRPRSIILERNGFNNIQVAIHEDVPENYELITKIKDTFTAASKFLYTATRTRAYFANIDILVPQTWQSNSRYRNSNAKSYYHSDIRIKNFKKTTIKYPYVKSFKGCGKPGEYMQITDNLLLDPETPKKFGALDKLIVHEWAHLRWGVFDEYPTVGDSHFYYSKTTGRYEPVRCTRDIVGRMFRLTSRGNLRECKEYDKNGMYPSSCKFFPSLNQMKNVVASVMDRQYVDNIRYFCDDSDESGRQHNPEAVNKQNELCSGRSTWSVIMSSPDFMNDQNPPRIIRNKDLIPNFTISRRSEKSQSVVLVLDESFSMERDSKLERMAESVSSFVQYYLPSNIDLGIVMFSTAARVLVPLTKLSSNDIRKTIVQQLPSNATGFTSIGDGLLKALQLIQNNKGNSSHGTIVLLSDGEENTAPEVDEVLPKVLSSEVTIHSIAFTPLADNMLGNIASLTGGLYDYASNRADMTKLKQSMIEIARELDPDNSRVQIFLKSHVVLSKDTLYVTGYLSHGLGKSTFCEITYSHENIDFIITSPSGRVVDQSSEDIIVSSVQNIRKFMIYVPGIAEAGLWKFVVTNGHDKPQAISVSFSTRPLNRTNYIILRSYQILPTLWPPLWTIMAEATQNDQPVTGLTIVAKVERPDESFVELELFDNGKGADLREGDGIYSRYFQGFNFPGRYSVTILAVAAPGIAQVLFLHTYDSASFRVDPDDEEAVTKYFTNENNANKSANVESGVSLVTSGGAIDFNPPKDKAPLLNKTDIYPPIRIRDLKVISTSFTKPSVTLSWTAPGDDLDEGTPAMYQIFVASTFENISEAEPVMSDVILHGNMSNPRTAGETERFIIYVNYTVGENVSYQFAVRAVDEAGNIAELSNIVSAGFGTVPPRVEINIKYDDNNIYNGTVGHLNFSTISFSNPPSAGISRATLRVEINDTDGDDNLYNGTFDRRNFTTRSEFKTTKKVLTSKTTMTFQTTTSSAKKNTAFIYYIHVVMLCFLLNKF